MIADQHGGTGLPRLFDATGTVGEDHGCGACRGSGANGVHNATNAVVLVVVRAGADDEGAFAARQEN